MKHTTSTPFNLLHRPMFWRMLLAFVILGYGHKVFGEEGSPATETAKPENKSWSVVIAPDNPETEGTVSTFTPGDNNTGEDKVETQALTEQNDPTVAIVPEVSGTFPTEESAPISTDSTPKVVSEQPCCDQVKSKLNYNLTDYVRIYNSIPFSRSQFDANPSYRHDATMEILLGQPKPVTIIKQEVKTQPVFAPYQQFFNPYINPWFITHRYSTFNTYPGSSFRRPYQSRYLGDGYGGYQTGTLWP